MNISKLLLKKACSVYKTIAFPEAGFSERTMLAIKQMISEAMCKCVLIGDESALKIRYQKVIDKCMVINPKTSEITKQVQDYIYQKRKEKGITEEEAKELAYDPHYFATSLVGLGFADGMVGGAEVSTAKNLKPALQLIKTKNGLAGSYFMFVGKNNVTDEIFFITDAGLNEKPNSEELCSLTEMLLPEIRMLSPYEPKVAFLSYSTNGSAKGEDVQKMKKAYEIFKKRNFGVQAIGEVQMDSALFEKVRNLKFKDANFKGSANVFVMPDINAGNICYKAIQYFAGLRAIGPITMGLNKPINDLSRGCSVQDIIDLTAITCLQAKNI